MNGNGYPYAKGWIVSLLLTVFFAVALAAPAAAAGSELYVWELDSQPATTFLVLAGEPEPAAGDEDHEVDPDPWATSPSWEWIAVVLVAPAANEEDHEVDPDPWAAGADPAPAGEAPGADELTDG